MRTDVAEAAEMLSQAHTFKVHSSMCTELLKLVHRISRIVPEIEKARPRCSSGIQALCLLQCANEEAKLLLQYYSQSSKLYLAITGDKVVSRCDQFRNLFEQNLGKIQSNVSVMLAAEIAQLINDLRGAVFIIDSSEKEAGKIMLKFLNEGASGSCSFESSKIKALRCATSKLHITSSNALIIEKRSIKKLMDKVGDSNPTKSRILRYLLYQLKKYGNFILEEQPEIAYAHQEESYAVRNSDKTLIISTLSPPNARTDVVSASSHTIHSKNMDGLDSIVTTSTDSSQRCHSNTNIKGTDLDILSCLAELQWESQCKVVEDVRNRLKVNDQIWHFTPSENCFAQLVRFLTNAHDWRDVRARRAGSQLLLEFVSRSESGIPYFHEDAFSLLASFLDSDVIQEALAIIDLLSGHEDCRSKIAASGALTFILENFDSNIRDFQESAIKVLYKLSSNRDICSQIVSMECIPKLVPFLVDTAFTRHCIMILENLCYTEEGIAAIAETKGCIASIVELLDIGNPEDQVHTVSTLLSLCSHSDELCQLVMDEGVIPPLVNISIKGNDNGKAYALELLRLLRDINFGE